MSGAAKMHRIEVLKPDGSPKKLYLVSEAKANAVVELLQQEDEYDWTHFDSVLKKYEDKGDDYLIDHDELFPESKDPKKRPIIVFRGIRTKNNLTQEQLAQKLGITQAEVSKIESGKRAIGKKLAKKIEKVFKMDYRRFL